MVSGCRCVADAFRQRSTKKILELVAVLMDQDEEDDDEAEVKEYMWMLSVKRIHTHNMIAQ